MDRETFYHNDRCWWGGKGLGPPSPDPATPPRWNLLREEVLFPAAVLNAGVMEANLRFMQAFVAHYGVKLAPHGKTTMAPALFRRQLAGGAWGITLATVHQVQVAYRHGVRRVLLANQLVGRGNLLAISDLLSDPGFEFYCLVDSAAGVELLGRFFGERGQRIRVLLELGVPEGRSGVRDDLGLNAVLAALTRCPGAVHLCGIEVYEGVLKDEAAIRAFLRRAVGVTADLLGQGCLRRSPAILSGAGSAWYDVVAEEFSAAAARLPLDVILRPGCYVTHDVGIYRSAQAEILRRNPVVGQIGADLQPALRLWATVLSRPEPQRAIIGLGKRDAAFDAGLPVPVQRARPGATGLSPVPGHWQVVKMMDQHAYLDLRPEDDCAVGDLLVFDISHPCLTFDKWRHVLVVDDACDVIEVVDTFF
jgi:D-serine dehydratase